ncbi:hypothetical protein VAB18032_10210 [Micromonospora maris AB-18-032]|nr:hypothetical protein VAB18032_10210 [Micromonospora maris AB-18-032]
MRAIARFYQPVPADQRYGVRSAVACRGQPARPAVDWLGTLGRTEGRQARPLA